MASLIQFLEAARTVWRWIVLVAAGVAIYSAYQYQNHQPNLFSGDDLATIAKSTKESTDRFFTVTFDRVLGRSQANPIGAAARSAIAGAGPETPNINQRAEASRSPSSSRTAANIPTSGTEPRSSGNGADRRLSVGTATAASSIDLERTDRGEPGAESDPRVRLAFRRFASQFCRATRSVAQYYTEHVTAPNGYARIRVGSGVRFPSIDRLTNGSEQSIAEKELEVRLRCDYELTYGAGERADPNRPAFESWRQATLERQYGAMWSRIDLTRIPTPDDPTSRGDWYLVTPPSQE
jgi:hypothetical protein